jgi:hypothetical protein
MPSEPSIAGTTLILATLDSGTMQNIGERGINCGNCAAYKATQADDEKKLSELASGWSSEKNKWKAENTRIISIILQIQLYARKNRSK